MEPESSSAPSIFKLPILISPPSYYVYIRTISPSISIYFAFFFFRMVRSPPLGSDYLGDGCGKLILTCKTLDRWSTKRLGLGEVARNEGPISVSY